jgi:hypothetical protein
VPGRFPLFQHLFVDAFHRYQSAPGALERLLNGSLLGSKVHRKPKQFHPLRKNLLENVAEKEVDVERAGKCNPVSRLLCQRTEGVFGDRDIASLRSESFKSQQVIIGLE